MDIFDCQNYKEFVHSWVKRQPKGGRGEWRRLSQHLEISSTLVSQIFNGPKELTPEQAYDLSSYFNFTELEGDYFNYLVQWQRAGTYRFRQNIEKKMEELKKKWNNLKDRLPQDIVLDEKAKAQFYSNWLYMATWILSSIPKYQSSEQIADFLAIPLNKVNEIVSFLIAAGLCVKTERGLELGAQRVHLEASSDHISRHHTSWRQKAIERSVRLTSSELMFTAPLALSKDDFAKIKKSLLKQIDELSSVVEASAPEIPACLNLDFFILTK